MGRINADKPQIGPSEISTKLADISGGAPLIGDLQSVMFFYFSIWRFLE